ncbi:MAG: alpha/beta hydrolase [Vampirovibrio sp.]|nr:alpha/beta hydrolase [Vampirovibrio sp.]
MSILRKATCACVYTLGLAVLLSTTALAKDTNKPIIKKVTYNDHNQKMVLCLPRQQTEEQAQKPFILFVHGGAWTKGFGSRWDFYGHCKYAARQGNPSATMSYRLSPRHAYPAAPNDLKDAILWIKNHIAEFGSKEYPFNGEQIVLVGHSAGGHLSLLVGLKEKDLPIAGIISLAGPTDLTTRKSCKLCTTGKKLFLRGASAEEASPINYAHADAPPVYLFHGSWDEIVDVSQSVSMAEKLKEAGAPVKLQVLNRKLHWFPFYSKKDPNAEKDVMDFIFESL